MVRFFQILMLGSLSVIVACKPDKGSDTSTPIVVSTTTMLGDLVSQIGAEHVTSITIMKPGGDPHLYQPTPKDAIAIAQSALVVTSGLHLEGWIDDLVRNAGGERPIIVGTDGVKPIQMANSPGGVDPHFWFDLMAWKIAAANVAQGIKGQLPPEKQKTIDENLKVYLKDVDQTHTWLKTQLKSIPDTQRVLVTSHDAFHYFGRAYDIEVVAIQGVSTEQEASDRDVVNVIEIIRKKNVPAVFVESSVNPALIKQVAKETGVKVAGPLYSDSIGAADSPAKTFLGTVRENTRMITQALGGTYIAFDFDRKERTQ